ncbi:MAG TPA: hypothetical protein VFF52_26340, partial [Isosphaeraceae bacterium]|nr:hypothetical protein [Isosphaeraceae bacterium]
HDLALYALDGGETNVRSEQIQLSSATTGAVLDTETISSFSGGVYLQWNVSGHVVITVTRTGGCNAVLSGLFFDPPSGAPPATATLVGRNTTTQGNWIGTYGTQGYNIIGNAVSYPAYATVTTAGASSWTWAASTTDPRGLETPGGSGRMIACWYTTTSFTIDVNLTDGQAHDLALYAVDWDNLGRSEQIQLSSATTGAVLDSETVSSFRGGVYLQWNVSGHVVIKVTNLGGCNAVLSGLFFDPPTSTSSVATASLVEGNAVAPTSAIGVQGNPASSVLGVLDFSSISVSATLPVGFSFAAEVGVPTFRRAASGARRPANS